MNNLLLDNRAKNAGNKLYFAKVIRFYASSNTADVVTIDDNISLLNCNIACSMPAGFAYGTRYFPTHDDQNSEVEYVNSSADIYCVAAFLEGDFNNAVVLGFIFPLQTTLAISEYGLYIFRHESDVFFMVRGDGTVQMYHPSGSIIKIGEDNENEITDQRETGGIYPAKVDGLYVQRPEDYNASKTTNLFIDWQAGQKVTLNSDGEIILQTKDAAATITMTPNGVVTIDSAEEINATSKDVTIDASRDVNINAAENANISVGENAFVHVDTGQVFLSTSDLVLSAPPDSVTLTVPGVGSYEGLTGVGHKHSNDPQFYVVNGFIIKGTYP